MFNEDILKEHYFETYLFLYFVINEQENFLIRFVKIFQKKIKL